MKSFQNPCYKRYTVVPNVFDQPGDRIILAKGIKDAFTIYTTKLLNRKSYSGYLSKTIRLWGTGGVIILYSEDSKRPNQVLSSISFTISQVFTNKEKSNINPIRD
jgi:hypothetical protein